MKILLDTNIIIHREAHRIINKDIGQLFNWIDKLGYFKYVHPVTIKEIKKYKDEKIVATMLIKLESYNKIKYKAPRSETIEKISTKYDKGNKKENSAWDTEILNEVYQDRVDLLISEDRGIHTKANELGISSRVFKIQSFLEKVTSENPELADYKVLAVKKVDFHDVDINDNFFDSFRGDYSEFNKWFDKKNDKVCYVCYDDQALAAFLYVKVEDDRENYSNIKPVFVKKKRLKIGTLKVANNGYKIGERFLKIVFDNALRYKVDEIYVTIFDKRPEQIQLIDMLKKWGFYYHGVKETRNGNEQVFARSFGKDVPVNILEPKMTFPFFDKFNSRKYIIKIRSEYHTELFPDSIHTKEDHSKYTENEPHRNRIGKVYISHSKDKHLQSGDIAIIYHMGETKPKKYSSTVTSICIIEEVIDNFRDFDHFFNCCNRRTVISKQDLKNDWWDKYPRHRPFIVRFLYAHSFPTPKPTLDDLNRIGVIPDIMNMPRGFIEISTQQFAKLVNFAYCKK